MSDGYWSSVSRDIKYSIYCVPLQNHVIEGSYSSLVYFTTLASLEVIDIVLVKICF